MADPNTSATGGPLLPTPTPPNPTPDNPALPLEGQALLRFVQQLVVGITGLPGPMVRPRWQSEPANIPDAGTAWAAIGIGVRTADTYPQIVHDGDGDGSDVMQRQEQLALQGSFYDLGSSGLADQYAALLRDGLVVAQNREVLLRNGFDLAFTGEITPAPVVLKTRWLYRVDLAFTLRRQIDRSYAVLNLKSAGGTIVALDGNNPVNTAFAVEPPTS